MYLFPSLYFKLFSSGFLKGSVQLGLAFLFILIIFHFNRGTFNIIICLDLNLSSCYLFSISSILSLFHFTYFGLIDCFIVFMSPFYFFCLVSRYNHCVILLVVFHFMLHLCHLPQSASK